MKIIQIVGRHNSGKTTLICKLIRKFQSNGYKIGIIKHSSNHIRADKKNKDSDLYFTHKASPIAIITKTQIGVFLPNDKQDFMKHLKPIFKTCDLIIIEGYKKGHWPKIEIYSKLNKENPLSYKHKDIVAIIADIKITPPLNIPVWPKQNINLIYKNICNLLKLQKRKN